MANRAALPAGRCARGLGDPARAVRRARREAALRLARRSCARRCSRRIRTLPRIDQIAPGDAADIRQLSPSSAGDARQGAVPRRDRRLLSHQSDRARLRGDGRMLGARRRPRRHDGGGVGAMTFAELWTVYLWPLIVIVAQIAAAARRSCWSSIAYVLLADRKIWAAVQIRRGPNVVGPVGPAAVLRRPAEVRAQGADHPGRRQQGRVPAGAAGHLHAGARRLGGDPGQCSAG